MAQTRDSISWLVYSTPDWGARSGGPPSKTTAAPGLSSGAVLPLGTYTVKSEAKVETTLLDTKTVSFTVAEPGAPTPTETVSEPQTQAVSAPPTSRTPAKVATQEGAAVVTPEGKPTTYTPLGITTVMLALTAVFGILVLRRRN